MKHRSMTVVLSLALAAALFGVLPAERALAASGTLDFGDTADGTTATTGNTGFGGVRIGTSNTGSFTIMNPGQEIGTQAELRGVAPSTGSINSVGVTSAEFGAAGTLFTVAFEVYFSGGSAGTWYFFAGNGTTFGASQTQTFTGSEVFTGLRFTYAASSAITTANRNAGNWSATGISGTPFAQNTPYTVSVIGNNSASSVNYGSGTVAGYKYDLWVNGVLVGDDLAKAQLANGTAINAFRFYGESSLGAVATINLDNIRWWNQTVPPSVSSYSIVSSIPASTYSVLNMNSGNASLAGDATVNELLVLNNGNLTLGNNTLTLGSSASVSGSPDANKMVVTDVDGTQTGKLCKAGLTTSGFTYPIGDNRGTAEYSPVTFTPTSPSGLTVCFRVVDDAHPNKPATPTTDYLTRYWNGTASAGSFTGYTGVFTFINDGSDVQGSTANMLPKRWTGAFPWYEQNNALSGATFTWNGGAALSDFTAFKSGILAVTLADFFAQQVNDHVRVTWETASELGNMGFNLYRGTSPAGPERRLNDLLIPSQSLGNPGGFVYTWDDSADLVPGTTYYYWVEDVDVNGAATIHGPVSVDFVVPTAVTLGSVQASPAAAGSLPWLWIVAGAGAALGAGRLRRRG